MKPAGKMADRRSFMLSSVVFIVCLCALAFINEFRFHVTQCNVVKSDDKTPISQNDIKIDEENDEIRILIGILTLPDQYHRRNFLRTIYGTQNPPGAKVDVKFVFCNLTKDDQMVLVALEIMRYDDIIILNCRENMNEGKTYTYFSSLPEIFNDDNNATTNDHPYPPYHYVMKTDDDTYFRLENLVASLKPLPREDLYYGYVIPCKSMDPFVRYMSGMGYLVSWDLVEWIAESEIPRNSVKGPEDLVFADWLRDGRRGKNRFNAKWSMYNFPEPHTGCTHDLWPNTIAVHLLKTQVKWIRTLNYFNVTQNLKPSKLYHIP